MANQLRFSLPGNKNSISTVRTAISVYARGSGFIDEAVEDIGVSVTEACRIICCHGYERKACRFLVVCSMKEDTLNIRITNNNAEFTIDKEECKLCGHCAGDGEFSLFILSSLMDMVELKEDKGESRTLVMQKILSDKGQK